MIIYNSFICKLTKINGSPITQNNACQDALYNILYYIFNEYDKCFPVNYKIRKPWLSSALNISIVLKKYYTKHFIIATKYFIHYVDLFNHYENTTRKTWNVIKYVIDKKTTSNKFVINNTIVTWK